MNSYDPLKDIRVTLVDANQLCDNPTDCGIRTLADGDNIIWFKSKKEFGGTPWSSNEMQSLWFGCRDRGNNRVAVDMDRRAIIGFCRDTKADLFGFLDRLDTAYLNEKPVKYSGNAINYPDNPSGLKLDRNIKWQERMRGVIFKNIKTNEEWKFKGVMGDIRRLICGSHYQVELIIFDGKIIKDWYIDRVEIDANKFLRNGVFTVPIELPIRTIVNITMLTKGTVSGLINGRIKERNGWVVS